ncbi:MAG: hypothetical protein JWM77_3744 [Rhodospirillales bacterium]|nr:hypothetical protein [Rhodospirillales bacterium]
MKLDEKLKTSLDETRMLVLGCQVLVGFQFQAGFQNNFDGLPLAARIATAVALLLLVASLASLIVPGTQHALVDRHEATRRIESCINRSAGIALLPLAFALAIDMALALLRVGGIWLALSVGAVFGGLALSFWYLLELRDRAKHGAREREAAAAQPGGEAPMSQKITYMLTEARTILPGVQAMLGFQLAVVLTAGFDTLPDYARWLHVAALAFMALAMILLMAPAAYHRIVYAGEDSERFLGLGGRMVLAATVPLALGLAADCCVAVEKIAHSTPAAITCGLAVLLALVTVWHAVPLWLRRR